MTDYGIDISHWNTVNDWTAVAGNNITFASIKVTESTNFTDPAAVAHIAGARSAGIHPGGYHFARDTAIDGQVIHFVNALHANGLLNNDAMAPMLDMEAAELRGSANPFIAEFIRQYRAVTGLKRIFVYANLDWWTNVLAPNEWADDEVRLWIARYNGDPGNPGWYHPRLALHQHTNEGVVPGIPGHVDRNATHGAFRLEHLTLGTSTHAPAPAVPAPATYTVQSGDTLSAIAQQQGTTWQQLAEINQLANPDLIHPGQVLRLA